MARAVRATAEPIESIEDALNIVGDLPWPTSDGPFYVSAQWVKVNGRNRLGGITISTVPSGVPAPSSFIPLTAQTFRRVRIGDIVEQLAQERRDLHLMVLDDEHTSTSDDSRIMLEADRAAVQPEDAQVSKSLAAADEALLREVGELFDAAHETGTRSPAASVLDQLAERHPEFRPPSPAVRSAFQARVGRLIRRARDLGYLKTEPLTMGRRRRDES